VDPGNDYTAYMHFFRAGHRPEQVRRIALTHGHPDHAAGIVELFRSYPTLGGESKPEVILHRNGPDQLKEIVRDFGAPIVELEGGEMVTLGGISFEVIHSPGHTWDGISFYHAPTRTLVCGDIVLPDSVAAPDPGAGGDLRHYAATLRGFLAREVDQLLPGHGAPVAREAASVVDDTYQAVLKQLAGSAAKSWMDVAERLVTLGYIEDGLYACERSLGSSPGDMAAQELRALCLNELGRFPEALEALEPVLRASPDSTRPLVAKGYALLWLERYDESIEQFEAALARRPALKEAQLYKGMALYMSGRGEEAMDIGTFRDEFAARFAQEYRERIEGKAAKEGERHGQDS
jgi:glyoxylase-like metal-dependent hydrolase (beta-lactamase superfamily II)